MAETGEFAVDAALSPGGVVGGHVDDQPANLSGDRAQQGPVVVVELGPIVLPAQHRQLVAQHDDLKILGTARAHGQTGQRREEAAQNAKHEARESQHIVPGQHSRPNIGHPQVPCHPGHALESSETDRNLALRATLTCGFVNNAFCKQAKRVLWSHVRNSLTWGNPISHSRSRAGRVCEILCEIRALGEIWSLVRVVGGLGGWSAIGVWCVLFVERARLSGWWFGVGWARVFCLMMPRHIVGRPVGPGVAGRGGCFT
ncbi:hypothetical protein [Candidatus Poriferisodalis sp.]|uniref:hypothetical protein n=1 Tax=Candidatus Poriferisodalis sp. TaxID=3101277 RepID=UPI003B527980